MKWAKEYVDVVLRPGFDMMKIDFVVPMLRCSIAHVLMLYKQGIITELDAKAILQACQEMERIDWSQEEYPGDVEDLFFLIEEKISDQIGADTVGNMHLAMSRNDLDTAMYRFVLRDETLLVGKLLLELRHSILAKALEYAETLMPAHTHNQQAQPTTVGHYLAAAEDSFGRDHQRIIALFGRINVSPLGACALATTGFPIDRHYIAKLLGFDGLIENSYAAVCTTDYMAEAIGVMGSILTTFSRLIADLLLWSTNEFAVLQLPDGYVQGSSIMPQKRNPVALEHLRAQIGRTIGRLNMFYTTIKGIPFGDVVDCGDDIQPVLRSVMEETSNILTLGGKVLANITINEEVLNQRLARGFPAVTELADTLSRQGIPFRRSHQVAKRVVQDLLAEQKPLGTLSQEQLDSICQEVLKRDSGLSQDQIRRALDPKEFVKIRKVIGGPAPDVLIPYLERAQTQHRKDHTELTEIRTQLQAADKYLDQSVAHLIGKGGEQ